MPLFYERVAFLLSSVIVRKDEEFPNVPRIIAI